MRYRGRENIVEIDKERGGEGACKTGQNSKISSTNAEFAASKILLPWQT